VWPKDHTGPRVVVSFAPLYSLAANVAGDDAVVKDMMTTAGPHQFQPTDREAKLLRNADLLFVNGLGLEGELLDVLQKGSGNKKLKVVELGDRLPKEMLLPGTCHHAEHRGTPHDHGMDPHVWLSPDHAIKYVEIIRDELKAADPGRAAGYERRAAEYITRLQKLKSDGLALLKDKKDRRLVSFHDSLTYFARAYDLNVVGVVENVPGSEPSDPHFKELIALCADDRSPVRVITVEPQYGNSSAGGELIKILKRHNVPDPVLVEIDPLETVPPDQLKPEWYEAKMRANLEALSRALK
jgi:ABC-type Zn uptake system ZnuABC Zn-binding protein ZnuA